MFTFQDWRNASFTSDGCAWSGKGSDARLTAISAFDYFLRCPKCDRVMDALRSPPIEVARKHWSALDDDMRAQIGALEQRRKDYYERRLERPEQLPDLGDEDLLLTWTDREGGDLLIKHGDRVLWREPAYYENYKRFDEIATLLTRRHGQRLLDLIPTDRSELYLYGDRISAPHHVLAVREQLRSKHKEGRN